MSAPPYRVPLGTAEEWTLENAFDPKLMEHAHVFHIHTNPFRITKRNGKMLSPPLWRDTYRAHQERGRHHHVPVELRSTYAASSSSTATWSRTRTSA